MAHELSQIGDKYEFAFLASDGLAWHNLGQPVENNQSIETWLQASNMGNWSIKSAPALFYDVEGHQVVPFEQSKILYRSDNKQPLATVSSRYNEVQPTEIVRFFDDIIKDLGFQMATCGVLFGGRRFWAMANIGQSVNILGKDRVDGKLLLATSCDGSLATTAQYTTVRVVCNNTLRMATGSQQDYVKVSHGTKFDAEQVKQLLGLRQDSLIEWGRLADEFAKYKLTSQQALEFIVNVFDKQTEDDNEDMLKNKAIKTTYELFNGSAKGSDIAPDTLWQAINAVTEYCDHHRNTKTIDARIDSAYFGQFAKIKDRAWNEAVLLAA